MWILKRYLSTTGFSIGIEGLQINKVNRQNESWTLKHTHRYYSYQQTRSSLLCMHTHVQLHVLCEKPESKRECIASWKQFRCHSSPVIAQRSSNPKAKFPLEEQPLGMDRYNNHICTVLSYCIRRVLCSLCNMHTGANIILPNVVQSCLSTPMLACGIDSSVLTVKLCYC